MEHEDERTGFTWDSGWVYDILECPACNGVSVCRTGYHSEFGPGEEDWELLYPTAQESLAGLPARIQIAFEAAEKVKSIEANAYAFLLRRLLEMICDDREAVGKTLSDQIEYLSKKGEIPEKLVRVTHGLRMLGNIAAHPSAGEVTQLELPILTALSRAVLAYVYTAPHLADLAASRIDILKKGRSHRTARSRKSPKGS